MADVQNRNKSTIDDQLDRKLSQLGSPDCDDVSDVESSSILDDPGICQQLTRRTADGFDTLMGYFRCQLEPRQLRYALHIPLYPAMAEIPTVEAVAMDHPTAKVRITDRQKFGLRMEIVLPESNDEAQSLVVEVTAYSPLTH